MSTIDALWVGSDGDMLSDGTVLVKGVTVVQISEGEAVSSDNWQPVGSQSAPPLPPAPPVSDAGGSDDNADDGGK